MPEEGGILMGIMIQTAVLVIAILTVRKLFGEKLHVYIRYGLWLLVALRLVIPVNIINSPLSLLRIMDIAMGRNQEAAYGYALPDSGFKGDGLNNVMPDSQRDGGGSTLTGDLAAGSTLAYGQPYDSIGSGTSEDQLVDGSGSMPAADQKTKKKDSGILMIRIMGSLVVGVFLIIAYYRFQSRLYRRRNLVQKDQLPIYQVKGFESPCLAGFIRPAVYIDSGIKPGSDYFRYIVTHEKVHYLHGDHIWALLRVVLVTVYWFHPFVWIAAAASARDGELACDHGTVRRLGEKERMTYGTMLVDLSRVSGRRRIYSYGVMLRPGKSEIKERILRLAGGNGSRMSAGLLAALVMLAVAGCAFTGVSQENISDGTGTDGAAAEEALPPENAGDAAAGRADNSEDVADDSEDTAESGVGDPDETISKERQLTAVPAALSEETPFGADGPSLDYAGRLGKGKENIVIFHDYFGLVVYDLTNRKVLQSLDLAGIDCDMTQGDNVCQTRVSADGKTVWLHSKTSRHMFRYEVEENLLYQVPLVKTFDIDLEAEDLFDRYLVTEEDDTGWRSNYLYEEYKDEKGLQTSCIYFSVSKGDELKLGNLRCVWDDMVYVLCGEDGTWPEQTDTGEGFPYDYDGVVEYVEIFYDEPCAYSRISDSFGSRVHPLTGDTVAHEGIDYAAEEGADVTAAADGVVYEKGSSDEYGNYIVLLHANGDMTYYCHCREITAADGAQVQRGEKIATVGNTGRSTGAHLHFALSRNGRFVDPAEYMEGYIVQLEE